VEVHIHVFLPFCRPVGVAFFFPSIIYANVLRFTFIFCGNLRNCWENFQIIGGFGSENTPERKKTAEFPLCETDSRAKGLIFVSRRGRM
jgi:hypothetical protein